MAVVISEIVTEVVVGGQPAAGTGAGSGAGAAQPDVEAIVRMATERVLEVLRREWDR